ncbi:hypothetical protein NEUTE1DRAFT_149678 [Neurospora tetrasperma FGSC 2508]|uniref:Uncharacterized protein n=1 Tax=Neurospora tetrasperma (strain FGSC 2508 / ATCC MYA-4615 / P0657) TaxID=510951 RepID=F8MZS6_NEUT8|nr:uncharacterized protein NEUTE1DRAFT_149678 [Neurospora tetrasperma FGSC 2508]EGO52063.1 hypothetical protein NEUTE1DRAFT_149678 [Neurospora tetrasperma FGSC 2508]
MASSAEVISQLIAYWGFSCPKDGSFYICPEMKHEFLGCCTVDPCTEERNGVCPDDELQVASFSSAKYKLLPGQSCDVSIQEAVFYTCANAAPPFMGCCADNPCNAGCPKDKLRPTVLNKFPGEEWKRDYILNPAGTGISYNSTKTKPESPSSSSSSTEPKPEPPSSSTRGLSTGAIAGIAVGAVIAVLIIVAGILWKCGWFPRKKKEGDVQEGDVPGAAMSQMGPMTPMGQQAYLHQGHQGYGYVDESGRSVMSSPSTGYMRVSQNADSYVSGLTATGSQYGPLSPALSKAGFQSQHTSPNLGHEGFDQKYGYNAFTGYQNNGLGLDTVSELPVADHHFGAQELPAGNHPGFEMDAGTVQRPQEQNQPQQHVGHQEGDRQDVNQEQATLHGDEMRN